MAYDEALASRIRAALSSRADVSERRMFGGIAFMIGDRMACGVTNDDLMVRVGKEAHDEALAQPHTRPMDFTGRPMRGFVYVGPKGTASDADLAGWLTRALDVATSDPTPGG